MKRGLILPSRNLFLPSRRSFIAGAASLLAAPAIVRAGQMSLLGAGGVTAGGGGGGVAIDAISHSALQTDASSWTWNHTPVGIPTAVAVLIAGYSGSGFPTSVTYNGVAMTAGSFIGTPAGAAAQIWGLANPPSGTQAISVSGAGGVYVGATAITVTGSDTATCFRNSSGSNGTGAAATATVSSAAGDLVIDCVGGFVAGSGPSGVGAGQTQQYSQLPNGNVATGVSTNTGAASVTDTWSTVNSGGTNTWAEAIASFKHA